MRVCVAGADCFIGIPLVKKLADNGNEVIAVVRNPDCGLVFKNTNKVNVLSLDFEKYDNLGKMVGEIDCLIVLTWIGTRGSARLDENLQRKNYEKIKSAITGVIDKGCKKILTAGSQAEYGLHTGLISEQTLCNPNTEYGKFKLKLFTDIEIICQNRGVSYKEPRFFSLYGPGDFSGTLIMNTITRMKNNLDCNFTQSEQMWDYLFIEDAVNAVCELCNKDCKDGPYNLGSGDRRQLKDYIEELKQIIGSESTLNFGSIPYGPSGIVSIEPNITKLKEETGWLPRYSFKDGIMCILEDLANVQKR